MNSTACEQSCEYGRYEVHMWYKHGLILKSGFKCTAGLKTGMNVVEGADLDGEDEDED